MLETGSGAARETQRPEAAIGQAQVKSVRQQHRIAEHLKLIVRDKTELRKVEGRRYLAHEGLAERDDSRAVVFAGGHEIRIARLGDLYLLRLVYEPVRMHFPVPTILDPDQLMNAQSLEPDEIEWPQCMLHEPANSTPHAPQHLGTNPSGASSRPGPYICFIGGASLHLSPLHTKLF